MIDGHAGPRNESTDGRHVENATTMSLHARDKAERKVRQCANIQIDHGELTLAIEHGRFTKQTETRVVDHICGLESSSRQDFRQLPRALGRTEIDGDYLGLGVSVRCDRRCQRVKWGFPPRHQDHGMAMTRKNVGERRADTRRRASNQTNWLNG